MLATVPQPSTREQALALINRCMPAFARGMAKADDAMLRHEAERLDSVPTSPVILTMREIVTAEIDKRHAAKAVAR